MMPIRVLIVDDHTIMRDGLRALLDNERDIEIVGTAADGLIAIRKASELVPDVIIMDISMPGTDGIEAVRSIKRKNPKIGVVVLTFHKEEHFVHGALDAGADSYVLKDESRGELMKAISSVHAGKNYLSPGITDRVVNGYLRGGSGENVSKPSWNQLTPREREVLKLVAEGYRTREIAEYLSLSHKTIEKHRANFMRKLDLHNVSAVTTYAITNGIISN
jgi:DNA-binding NarL/FixJ family response regulator